MISQRKCTILLALVLMPATFAGCGGDAEAETAASAVDPRFATADALIDHYNDLALAEPRGIAGEIDLYYAENELQRQWVDGARSIRPVAELEEALAKRGLNDYVRPTRLVFMEFETTAPAEITTRTDSRAEAEYIDRRGNPQTLHLVQIGERWWISGYTIERRFLPDNQLHFDSMLTVFDHMGQREAVEAPQITARVRAGEFNSAREAFTELYKAVGERLGFPSGDSDR